MPVPSFVNPTENDLVVIEGLAEFINASNDDVDSEATTDLESDHETTDTYLSAETLAVQPIFPAPIVDAPLNLPDVEVPEFGSHLTRSNANATPPPPTVPTVLRSTQTASRIPAQGAVRSLPNPDRLRMSRVFQSPVVRMWPTNDPTGVTRRLVDSPVRLEIMSETGWFVKEANLLLCRFLDPGMGVIGWWRQVKPQVARMLEESGLDFWGLDLAVLVNRTHPQWETDSTGESTKAVAVMFGARNLQDARWNPVGEALAAAFRRPDDGSGRLFTTAFVASTRVAPEWPPQDIPMATRRRRE